MFRNMGLKMFSYSEYFIDIYFSVLHEGKIVYEKVYYNQIFKHIKNITLLSVSQRWRWSSSSSSVSHSRQLACLDSDSPAVLCPEVSAGPTGACGAQCQQTVLKKGSPLEPAGNDLWLTFHDSSLFRLTQGGPLVPLTPFYGPLFTLCDPTASPVFCPSLLTLYLSYTEYWLHPHREGEPIRGCWPEAEEFGSEVVSVGEQQIVDHHGQEAELSTSGKS